MRYVAHVAKHTAASTQGRGRMVLVALVALLLVVVGLGAYRAMSRADGGQGDGQAGSAGATTPASAGGGCTPVTVWAAPEVLPAVESAAARASTGCFVYEVAARGTATARSALLDGDPPDVWVPSSTAWPQLAAEDGVDLQLGQVVASSPVLLATSPGTADAVGRLGIGGDTSFGELIGTYRELSATGQAPVTLRVGDLRVDPATMALVGTLGAQPGGWAEAGTEARGLLVLLAQTAVQGDPVEAVAADPTTLVPATEQQLASAAEDGEELEGLALAGGLGVVRVPFVRVGDTGSAEAVDALEQELVSADAAADLTALGLRPGTDGEAPEVAGVPDGLTTTGPDVDAEVVALAEQTWSVVAPQSRILTLIDISGSMEARIGDTTRIDLTREAARTGVSVIPEQTAIGLWYFATALDGDNDYEEQVPLRALNEEVRNGVTQKELLLAATEDLGLGTLTGDTGLHDSLWAAYQYMQERQSPDTISSVLLLTDGINDDTTGGLSEDEVVELLTQARESSEQPVTVVLIGMGPAVDEEALERLATAAGGESFVLRDPRELPQVFVDVVARRAP